ncbi:hypothetical protein BKA70DRAFT_1527156 [Coprinopsis sp. MPI-PUGE-AT-0042]|nr:hypothetical protein BKA70DRAFT_1527156 [Coprinopsis sp. MPI-PUGE-AT-0042]
MNLTPPEILAAFWSYITSFLLLLSRNSAQAFYFKYYKAPETPVANEDHSKGGGLEFELKDFTHGVPLLKAFLILIIDSLFDSTIGWVDARPLPPASKSGIALPQALVQICKRVSIPMKEHIGIAEAINDVPVRLGGM